MEVETTKTADFAAHGCLIAGQRAVAAS